MNHEHNLVNNIYFDDKFISSAYEGIEGNSKREKKRIRWYNNRKEYVLESKIKFSLSGYKNRELLASKSLSNAIKEAEMICKKTPIIQNSYFRRYYFKENVRLTIDSSLKFCLPESENFKSFKKNIIEIKYNTADIQFLDSITNEYLNLTKFSKYITGLRYFDLV